MKVKAEQSYALKDQLFNQDTIRQLVNSIKKGYPKFEHKKYLTQSLKIIVPLELKARIDALAQLLEDYLPESFPKALTILEKSLPPPLDPTLGDNDFGDFIWAVPGQYAARRGCNEKYLDRSLSFLRHCTQRFSAEFALRPFLKIFPERTLEYATLWAQDENYHVRRLASEGIRPKLPWAEHSDLPPERIFKILELLYEDSSQFVRRSVANNINDLSKMNLAATLEHLELKRLELEKNSSSHRFDWIIQHGLRSALKTGNPKALALLGYQVPAKYQIIHIEAPSSLQLNQVLDYQASLISKKDQKLLVTLNLFYLKANQTYSKKSYKITNTTCQKNETLLLKKSIPLKPMSTRTLYAGRHFLELQINGQTERKLPFNLVM